MRATWRLYCTLLLISSLPSLPPPQVVKLELAPPVEAAEPAKAADTEDASDIADGADGADANAVTSEEPADAPAEPRASEHQSPH